MSYPIIQLLSNYLTTASDGKEYKVTFVHIVNVVKLYTVKCGKYLYLCKN